MYSTVIWDWNGTLLNDVHLNHKILNSLLVKRNMEKISLKSYRKQFKMPIKRFYEDIGFNFNNEPFSSVAEEYFNMYREMFPLMSLTIGVKEILNYLSVRRIDQHIVSAAPQHNLIGQVQEKGIAEFFRKIIGNDDNIVTSKVNKAIELHKEIDENHRILFIGDMDHDFEVAQAIGASCILYSKGHQEIKKSKDYIRINGASGFMVGNRLRW